MNNEPTRADIAARALDTARFLASDPSKVPDQVALEQDYWVVHREPTVALSYTAICDRIIDCETDPGALLGYVALEMLEVEPEIVAEYDVPERELPDGDIDRWHLIYRSIGRVCRLSGNRYGSLSCLVRENALFNEMTRREMATGRDRHARDPEGVAW